MKKTLLTSLLIAGTVLAAVSNMGCSVISSSTHASTTVSGEAWYVRSGPLGGLRGIYYCPASTPTQCFEAEVRR